MGARNGRHTNEIIGAREERSEGRGERYLMAHAHANSRRHKLLLRDILLEESFRIGFGKLFGIRGIADFAIQSNHVGVSRAQRLERITIGFARGKWLFAVM